MTTDLSLDILFNQLSSVGIQSDRDERTLTRKGFPVTAIGFNLLSAPASIEQIPKLYLVYVEYLTLLL